MTEVLFRGKHIHVEPHNKHLDRRWIEGYLCDKNYINSPELDGEFLIEHETICQYTGLTDKNEKKIFDGDIISALFLNHLSKPEIRIGIVIYEKGAFSILWKDEIYGKSFLGYVKDVKVIGNIFDNPELVEEFEK